MNKIRANTRYTHKLSGKRYRLLHIATSKQDCETQWAVFYDVSFMPDIGGELWCLPLVEFAEKFELDESE